MGSYEPPFTISNRMVSDISRISEKLGRISNYRELESKPQLRRNNRIRSIHSSLAIEANSLSLDAVRSVLDGKPVIGPQREIQEVKNAYSAYEAIGSFDPYSVDDLKRLHGVMTFMTVDESGEFRCGEEGVFNGNGCIFMAPPARLVTENTEDLFRWMKHTAGEVHPLILSSVFHYEFVFIHPFTDGNGRMARLWQTALLTQWNPVFQYLPIESRIQAFQPDYYDAIARCHSVGNSDIFIEFMLDMIEKTLDTVSMQVASNGYAVSQYVQKMLDAMEYDVPYSANGIMARLGLKSKETLRKNYINPALNAGLIVMGIPGKPTSRNQTYIKK